MNCCKYFFGVPERRICVQFLSICSNPKWACQTRGLRNNWHCSLFRIFPNPDLQLKSEKSSTFQKAKSPLMAEPKLSFFSSFEAALVSVFATFEKIQNFKETQICCTENAEFDCRLWETREGCGQISCRQTSRVVFFAIAPLRSVN